MNLTIKDVPSTLHRKLKAQAEANQRSLNGEVIYLLAQAAESKLVDVELVGLPLVTSDKPILLEFPETAIRLDDYAGLRSSCRILSRIVPL